jgi:hypothetical protein
MKQQRYERLTVEEHRAIGASMRNFNTTICDSCCEKQPRVILRRRYALMRALDQLANKLDSEMYANYTKDSHSPYYGDGLLLIGRGMRVMATPEHVEELQRRFDTEVAQKLNNRVPAKIIDLGTKVWNAFHFLKVWVEDGPA